MNDKSQVSLDHIAPTEREKALIEQYNNALETVAHVASQRDTLQSQLTQAQAELAELWSKTGTIINDRTKSLTIERDEAVAACAAWKQVCHFRPHPREYWDDTMKPDREAVYEAALQATESKDCGKAFLERMKEAEWLLSQPLLPKMFNQSELTEYRRRYHAFQKGGVK